VSIGVVALINPAIVVLISFWASAKRKLGRELRSNDKTPKCIHNTEGFKKGILLILHQIVRVKKTEKRA